MPCDYAASMSGREPGPGEHTLSMRVEGGPTDRSECSATLTVNQGTWCWLNVNPVTGTVDTLFAWSHESNGTGCQSAFNNNPPESVTCEPVIGEFSGALLHGGANTIRFLVDDGPSGPTECSVDVWRQ